MFLIEGRPDEATGALVAQRLTLMNRQVVYFNTTHFPQYLHISYDPTHISSGFIRTHTMVIPLTEVEGVFSRRLKWTEPPEPWGTSSPDTMSRNIDCALASFCRLLPCVWVNPLDAVNEHRHKAFQLAKMHQAGLRIPKTLVTNAPDQVHAFYEAMGGNIIMKFPQKGRHTERVTANFTQTDWYAHLDRTPVKLQECIEGVDVRVYVVGEEVFAMRIYAESIDFREQPYGVRQPIVLPDSVQQQCRLLRAILGLNFVGIDLKETPDGEYVFFEGNPTPIFVYDEVASGYPISQTIAEFLCGSQ